MPSIDPAWDEFSSSTGNLDNFHEEIYSWIK